MKEQSSCWSRCCLKTTQGSCWFQPSDRFSLPFRSIQRFPLHLSSCVKWFPQAFVLVVSTCWWGHLCIAKVCSYLTSGINAIIPMRASKVERTISFFLTTLASLYDSYGLPAFLCMTCAVPLPPTFPSKAFRSMEKCAFCSFTGDRIPGLCLLLMNECMNERSKSDREQILIKM